MAKRAPSITVYVIDDDLAVRVSFERLLRVAGMDPRPYTSAQTFLDEVKNGGNACVLLDITMPKPNGPQVLAELRRRGNTLPVIVISAREDEHTRASAQALGARMFLRKPVDGHALLDAINWVVSAEN